MLHGIFMECPHCGCRVGTDEEAMHGCKKCVKEWVEEMDVDHPAY